MTEIVKRLKVLYSIYNFFHKSELYRNEILYNKYGIKKKYYSSISSKDFKGLPNNESENYKVNQQELCTSRLFKTLNDDSKNSVLAFEKKGFAVLRNFLSATEVDDINVEVDSLIEKKKVRFTYGNKIMFAIHASSFLWNIGNNKILKELLSLLLGGNAILFQSINFLMGSEQETHSDSIHMTTYPLGGLLGVWIALEDITEENGPLHYYPGSHKLPFYLNEDYDNEGNFFMLGNKSYNDYEKMIGEKIKERKLNKVNFFAKKGDVLIWHANLFHGGDIHINKNKTRKSMVFHYFNENCICYHEITQRPAIFKNIPDNF